MFPTLIEFPDWIPLLGGHALHTYGLMVALGFLAGLWWVKSESARLGLDSQKYVDLFFQVVVAALVGSRLLYVLISTKWWSDPLVFVRVWEGGLVFYGGLIAAVTVSIIYAKKHHISFFITSDIFAPGIALGHAIGRMGCFAAGCCYGRHAPHDAVFSVLFPKTKYSIAPTDGPLYPVQLFETVGELIIFSILFLFRKKKRFDGEIFILYITFYPILRFILEFFRGDDIRGHVGLFSTSQWISIIWFLIALGFWIKMLKAKAGKKVKRSIQ